MSVIAPAILSMFVAAGDSGGANAVWGGPLVTAVVALIVGMRIYRVFFRRRKIIASKEPIIPMHPVVLPANRGASPFDQPTRLALPIVAVRDLFGPAPRQFSADLKEYLAIIPPPWLKRQTKDDLQLAYRFQDRIRRDGTVVWAAIVQANSLLFRRGPTDSPASVIFSLDPWYDSNPDDLQLAAHELFQLKGTDQNDADAAAFARMLTNELTRAMMLRAPKRFTGGRNVFHSSIMLPRKHLPKGYLAGSIFPVWVDPTGTGALLLVPAAYWPPSLTAAWDRTVRAKV